MKGLSLESYSLITWEEPKLNFSNFSFHALVYLFQHKIGHYFKGADKEARNEKLKLRVFIYVKFWCLSREFFIQHISTYLVRNWKTFQKYQKGISAAYWNIFCLRWYSSNGRKQYYKIKWLQLNTKFAVGCAIFKKEGFYVYYKNTSPQNF